MSDVLMVGIKREMSWCIMFADCGVDKKKKMTTGGGVSKWKTGGRC